MIYITPIAAQRKRSIDRSSWDVVTVWDERAATKMGGGRR
jgi:hypothetical protein